MADILNISNKNGLMAFSDIHVGETIVLGP
jgi:hypothetical protein